MNNFYSRKSELDSLEDVFNKLNGPGIVYINGQSGFGKTRLVKEFYSRISSGSHYWKPVTSYSGIKDTEVVPEYDLTNNGKLDWLFLCTRALESSSESYAFCFERIRHQFSFHLPGIIKSINNRAHTKKVTKSALGILLGFAIPGSGSVVELINSIKDISKDSYEVLELLDAIKNKYSQKPNTHEHEIYATETSNLSKQTQLAFSEIFKRNKDFKIVIYLEDIHWIDSYTCYLVMELFSHSKDKGWNILFVFSGWPEMVLSKGSDEYLSYYKLLEWINLREGVLQIDLKGLNLTSLSDIIDCRLPKIQNEVKLHLAEKCRGDIDLLHDYINEIKQSSGWIDENGSLTVDMAELRKLPTRAVEMAKSRLLAYPDSVRNSLCWSTIEGIVFDQLFIEDLMNSYGHKSGYADDLFKAAFNLSVISLKNDPLLFSVGEFKRVAFFEACLHLMERNPAIKKIRLDFLIILSKLIQSSSWGKVSKVEKGRIIETFLGMLEEIPKNKLKDFEIAKVKCLIDIARYRLLIGDFNKCIDICKKIVKHKLSDSDRDDTYYTLSEALYYSGKFKEEKNVLTKWKKVVSGNSFLFNLQYSNYMRRNGKNTISLLHINNAINTAKTIREKIRAQIDFMVCLWSAGDVNKAYQELLVFANDIISNKKEEALEEVYYHHCACLILHDLEKNKQVVQHSKWAMAGYEMEGDILSQLISKVNYADALLGMGYLNKAEAILKTTYEEAEKHELPHALDIAYICYANVLQAKMDYQTAAIFYIKGISTAGTINHNWDYYYGKIYYGINLLSTDQELEKDYFKKIYLLASKAGYLYLANLAYAAECSRVIQDGLPSVTFSIKPELPIGSLFFYAERLVNNVAADDDLKEFISVLGKCEGLKFNRKLIFEVIDKLVKDASLNPIDNDFLLRWKNSYIEKIEETEAIKLKQCDFRLCEARCCYDGVYLLEGEEEMIKSVVSKNRSYFKDIPDNFIVEAEWNGKKGKKTAVKPHVYRSPDFPSHFTNTRCVFASEIGACSLQDLSMKDSGSPWLYKPKACRIHPLQVEGVEFLSPPSSIDADKNDLGIIYPGYVSYTPCGINRVDGNIWMEELKSEIDDFNT